MLHGRDIATVRSFNRLVTQRVGALNSRYLGIDRPMAESRLLFEIGTNGAKVRELRARLDLDSGFVSRMLRSLERAGLVTTTVAADDARARVVQLTRPGRKELDKLNQLSDDLARSMLQPLGASQSQRLVTAMMEVERLLRASTVTFAVEDPLSKDAQWCLNEYFKELNSRFENGFDLRLSPHAQPEVMTPPKGYLLIARLAGAPVGCGALKLMGDGIGDIKRMWVSKDARGLGLGRRFLGEIENLARDCKLRLLRLETNKSLLEAQALYRSSGYTEVPAFNDEPYGDHWFQKRLR